MRQHQVLLMRHAQLIERVLLREASDGIHLLGRRIARRAADRLERDRHRRIAGLPVGVDIALEPAAIGGSRIFSRATSTVVALMRSNPALAK
jgi:hypothetical protein